MSGSSRVTSNDACKERSRATKGVRLVLGFLCLLVVVGASTAFADDPPSSAELPLGVLQDAIESSGAVEPPLTDPLAAEELPHRNLGREEAVELTEAVFEPVLQNAAGPIQDLEVESYLSDTAAIVSAAGEVEGSPEGEVEGEESVLLESTLPLRTDGTDGPREPVDLDLGASGDSIQPLSPLVEVELPKQLGDGIFLPETGIGIALNGAPDDRAPSIVDEAVATYPNVATDTDFSAAPTPTGVETFTTLRSVDSPRSQTFHLDLPEGSTLSQDQEGAKVTRGGDTILKVLSPSAIDAEGAAVPVALTVSGDSFTLKTSPGEDSVFPILVDPIVESYDWYDYKTFEGQDIWHANNSVWGLIPAVNNEGLFIQGNAGHYSPGDQAGWYYWVPRLKAGEAEGNTPTSFIVRMDLWHMSFVTGSGPYSPYMSAGILSPTGWAGKAGQPPAVWAHPGNGAPFAMNPGKTVIINNGEPGKRDEGAKVGLGLGLSSAEDVWTSTARQVGLGAATVEVSDTDKPLPDAGSISESWVNQTAKEPITARATDNGLGVKHVGFAVPGQGVKLASHPCIGTVKFPCPAVWTGSIPTSQYNPAQMPQGYDVVPITVEDVVHNQADPGSVAVVAVDHTAPRVAFSGTLTEQASLGTTGSQYTLNFNATDGDSNAATALSPFGTPGTGETQLQRPMGVAVDSKGNVWVVDRENNRVEQFTASGNFNVQFGSFGSGQGQFKDPRGIAISPNGNIWVSDFGNKRIQQFTPSGTFVRQITYGGQFVQPYGLAVAPDESLWVADTATHRVMRFSQTGTFLYEAHGAPAAGAPAGPIGVASDSNGNVWVTDAANSRVMKFDSTGNYITQFGSKGAGDGQLSDPAGVAVASSGNILVADGANNRVQVFQPTGTYLRKFGAFGIGNAQFSEPRGLAVTTDNIVYVADAGNRRVARWSHGDFDPQSGVTKVELKIDDQAPKVLHDQACATEDCAKAGSLSVQANDYAPGEHKVLVTATDEVKLSTPRELTFKTVKDVTAPLLSGMNSLLFTAPAGWLEQKAYSYSVLAKDAGGYGVKSLVLKIDGNTVNSSISSCPNGGCMKTLSGTINMATYKGGAHPAELIATDEAGLSAKKEWTINVNPKGVVPVGETTDTLEAFEGTVEEEMQPVAPTEEFLEPDIIQAGDNPGFQVNGGSLESTGTPASTSIDVVTETVTIDGTDDPIEITPVGVGSPMTADVEAGVAAVTPSVSPGVDTVVRPEYNGALFFTDIRLPSSADEFTWRVNLRPGQTVVPIDDQFAKIVFKNIITMGVISAMPAHDATGAEVPTHLKVDGPDVTLVVSHKAKNYVYPVLAGHSFEVGYSSVIVIDPPPPIEGGGEYEDSEIAEQQLSAQEPLNDNEFKDVDGWSFSAPTGWSHVAGTHRDKNKPVTLRQARRIARIHRLVRTSPPPAVISIGGPGGNGSGGSERRYDVLGRVCSDLICDIWDVEFAGETEFAIVRTGSQSGGGEYASPYGPVHCGGDKNFWWSLNIFLDTASAGTRGPTVVNKGSGKHLTFWCKFHIGIFFVPELPGEYFEQDSVLIVNAYPNGYQRMFTQPWNTFLNPI